MFTKCLILGGRGFIGRNLSTALAVAGYRVRVFDRPDLTAAEVPDTGIEFVGGDFLNRDDVALALEGCDIVFHLLSTTLPQNSNDNPPYDVETNLVGTLQLLEMAKSSGMKKIVFASSGGTVYGTPLQVPIPEEHATDPLCAYGISKLAIEKFLHLYRYLYGLDYCVLRLANAYGEGQSPFRRQGAIAVFAHKALRNEPIEIWGDGGVVRDYVYIKDVVDAFLSAMQSAGDARIFNIGSGRGHSINELLAGLELTLGRAVARRYSPGRNFDVSVNVLDISKAYTELGWMPQVSLQTGLARMVEWIARAHP